MSIYLVLTIVGTDRPGLVSRIAERATAHGADWLESRMAGLAGQFAGIVRLRVPEAQADGLVKALGEFEGPGLHITAVRGSATGAGGARRLHLDLVGQDHPGIVRDIAQALARHGVSMEELITDCESGSMSGESLFRAQAQLLVPAGLATHTLRSEIESLANDLMVDVTLDEDA